MLLKQCLEGNLCHQMFIFFLSKVGFPGPLVVKEPTCQCRRPERHKFSPWVGKIPWRRKWQPTPVFLPGKSHRGAQWGIVHSVTESDMTEATWHISQYRYLYQKIRKFLNEGKNTHLKNQKKDKIKHKARRKKINNVRAKINTMKKQ